MAVSGNHDGKSLRGATEDERPLFPTNAPRDRIERTCATNHTGRIPMLRLIASNTDACAVFLSASEISARYIYILGMLAVIIVIFGLTC